MGHHSGTVGKRLEKLESHVNDLLFDSCVWCRSGSSGKRRLNAHRHSCHHILLTRLPWFWCDGNCNSDSWGLTELTLICSCDHWVGNSLIYWWFLQDAYGYMKVPWLNRRMCMKAVWQPVSTLFGDAGRHLEEFEGCQLQFLWINWSLMAASTLTAWRSSSVPLHWYWCLGSVSGSRHWKVTMRDALRSNLC